MKRQQIEALVLQAWTRRETGSSDEDSWVEFKRHPPQRDWTPEQWWGLARRVAALANSARGEPILIIFEDPTTSLDTAEMWPRLWKFFDEGVYPEELATFEVQVSDSRRVLVASFETDRPPYVVQVYTGKGDKFRPLDFWDVPFRRATGVVAGRRHNLARLILPIASRPVVEAQAWSVSFSADRNPRLIAELKFFVAPRSLSPCYLRPEARGQVSWKGREVDVDFKLHDSGQRTKRSPSLPPPQHATYRSDDRHASKPSREEPIHVSARLTFEPGKVEINTRRVLLWDPNRSKWLCGPEEAEVPMQFF